VGLATAALTTALAACAPGLADRDGLAVAMGLMLLPILAAPISSARSQSQRPALDRARRGSASASA
jgi:hypothetical protein